MRITDTAVALLLSACMAVAGASVTAGAAAAQPTSAQPTPTSSPVTLPAPAPPAPAPPDACVKGQWPQVVQGRPTAFQAGQDGAYLWHDPDGGWALRVTHAGPHDRVVFAGTLVTDGRFTGVHSVDTEPDDIVFPTGHTIVFRFVNYGWVDGLDFGTRCADGFTMTLRVSGQFASTTVIHLGAGGTNPGSNPFDIDRVYGPPASSLPTTTPSTTTTS